MKNQKHLNFTYILILLFHLISYAQQSAPGDFGGSGSDPAPNDVPLNSQLWILIVIGIAFAFIKTRRTLQNK